MWRFLLLVSLLCILPSARGADEWLPLAKGNYWVYRGPTRWTDRDKVSARTMTLRMEVTEVLRGDGGAVAAVVKGFPADLAWYEPGKGPGDYLIVGIGGARYYLFSGDDLGTVRREFARKRTPSLGKLLEDSGELILDGPLTRGKHYGDPGQFHRDMYCWVVGAPTPFSGAGLKGLPAAARRVFPVDYRTNPDSTRLEVVPGVGIVAYRYEHHGTVAETDLRLVEVHLAPP